MTDVFIYLDGQFYKNSDPVFSLRNRAFRYGDSLFETIRVIKGNVCFLHSHLQRLKKGMLLLGYEYDEQLTEESLQGKLNSLLEKNQVKNDARIRLTLFRKGEGYYTPETNSVSLAIETEAIKEQGYTLNIKGLTVDIFSEYKKNKSALSSIKNGNALLYVLAGLYKTRNKLDDCILLNDNGNIIEAISSNIFAVKNGVLYTSPVEDGCVNGVMREQVLKIAAQNRIAVYEIELKMNVLLNSDELFFTNAVNGIQWVGAYKSKRFYNTTAKLFTEKINKAVEEMILSSEKDPQGN